MNKRCLKALSVVLSVIMLAAMTSVAFAATASLPGSGTKEDPYLLSNLDGIWDLVDNTAAYNGKYIALSGSFSLGGEQIEPIGTEETPFTGFFDGRGFTISNFELSGDDYSGFFGYVKNASISNFTIKNATYYCAPADFVGAVAGYAENTEFSNVKTENCTMEAGSNAGGIVGMIKGGTVSNCVNGCAVTLNKGANAGGIAGKAENSQILRCINTAALNGKKQKNVAGIAGSLNGTVSHCLNKGAVSSAILNQSAGTSSGAAGIAGSAAGTISFCGNGGSVTSATDCSGIFAAAAGALSVSFCYNAGTLSCNDNYVSASDTIGLGASSVENCIGVGGDVTAAMLEQKDTYAGWDFDTVWYAPGDYHGYTYPVLQDCNFHKISKASSSAATCTSAGVDEYKCDLLCGFTYDVTTAPELGHRWVVSSTKAANCTYEGEKTYKCSRCQQEKPEKEIIPIDPNAHVDADNDNICDLCEKTIKEEEVKRNFFQKIVDFFKRIFDWIKNLFTRK